MDQGVFKQLDDCPSLPPERPPDHTARITITAATADPGQTRLCIARVYYIEPGVSGTGRERGTGLVLYGSRGDFDDQRDTVELPKTLRAGPPNKRRTIGRFGDSPTRNVSRLTVFEDFRR